LGQGTIRGIESLGLSIIRIIEEEALKENTAQVRAILPTEIAAYLLNEKRQAIIDIEKRQNVAVIVVPSSHLLTPQYEVERIRLSDMTEKDEKMLSYKLAIKSEISSQTTTPTAQKVHQEPAIKTMSIEESSAPAATSVHSVPHPQQSTKGEPGILKKFFKMLFEKKEEPVAASENQQSDYRKTNRMRPTHPRHKGSRHRPRGGRRDNRGTRPGGGYRGQDNRDNRDKDFRTRDARPPRDQYRETGETRDSQPQEIRQPSNIVASNTPQVMEQPSHAAPQQTQAVNQQPARNYPAQPAQHAQHAQHESNVRPVDFQSNTNAPAQQTVNVANQPIENTGERPPRKPRPRFHPRHRHSRPHAAKSDQSDKHTLEGEDIYSVKKKESDEG
jgi:ribonuclease E